MGEHDKELAALCGPNPRFPFSPAPRLDAGRWGVWDNRHESWAEKPRHNEATAERLALVMIEAYAAGFADAKIGKSLWCGRARPPS